MNYLQVVGLIADKWLIIADQSRQGIFDSDCLALSQLHSDAVDYPKSGKPVPIEAIPRLKFKRKPDWDAPETLIKNSTNYYESDKALGKLYRAIDLPVFESYRETSYGRCSRPFASDELDGVNVLLSRLDLDNRREDPVYAAVETRVARYIPAGEKVITEDIAQIFLRYASELQNICATSTLSFSRSSMLTEEEATVGTIVAKSSQPRRRADLIIKMRERTDCLVRRVLGDLAGDAGCPPEAWLSRSWACWRVSVALDTHFGAKSFGWVALGAIFDAIEAIEKQDGTVIL